ncbi:MAG: hypothetical protein SWK76_09945 [Actinomycetota bacterium]|nr:hypothetical protein [Actinomycetota bacterium]
MGSRGDTAGPGGQQEIPGGNQAGPPGEGIAAGAPPRAEKKRRKVSLIAAIVVNVITIITVAIVILAILLPGYRRSFTIARAVKGASQVLVIVKTTENAMRNNGTDFINSQDGLRNALQELAEGGVENVWAYVRDNFPDSTWIEENLPDDMQSWLKELYPSIAIPLPDIDQDGQGEEEETAPVEEGEGGAGEEGAGAEDEDR